jgi:hypothetical protein
MVLILINYYDRKPFDFVAYSTINTRERQLIKDDKNMRGLLETFSLFIIIHFFFENPLQFCFSRFPQ